MLTWNCFLNQQTGLWWPTLSSQTGYPTLPSMGQWVNTSQQKEHIRLPLHKWSINQRCVVWLTVSRLRWCSAGGSYQGGNTSSTHHSDLHVTHTDALVLCFWQIEDEWKRWTERDREAAILCIQSQSLFGHKTSADTRTVIQSLSDAVNPIPSV